MALTYTRPAPILSGVRRRSARAASTLAKKVAQRAVRFATTTTKEKEPYEAYPTEIEESEGPRRASNDRGRTQRTISALQTHATYLGTLGHGKQSKV